MHAWEAIQSALDYAEDHLHKDISTEEAALKAGLSPFYFQRLFKRLVNKPFQEYVKLRRLAAASEALKREERRILDIALEFGFSSHANFTRAFKETYGITPEEYRLRRPMLNHFLKPEVSLHYVLADEGVPLIVGSVVIELRRKKLTEPENYLGLSAQIGITAQTPAGERTGIDVPGQLWEQYHSALDSLREYVVPGIEMGMSHSADPANESFTYFAGGLLKAPPCEPKPGFIKQELPAGEYIVCEVEAESFKDLTTAALDQAGKYLFGTWLPGHSLTTQPFSAEKYDLSGKDSIRMELWVMPLSITN